MPLIVSSAQEKSLATTLGSSSMMRMGKIRSWVPSLMASGGADDKGLRKHFQRIDARAGLT